MSTNYEPGTVAVATVRGVENVRVMKTVNDAVWCTPKVVQDGGFGGFYHDEGTHVTDVRPLVVLDLDAPEVEKLRYALTRWAEWTSFVPEQKAITRLLDQIEAQTKPPKPEEPTGLGAVVRDREGHPWTRIYGGPGKGPAWHCDDARGKDQWATYNELDVVEKLSDGWSENA